MKCDSDTYSLRSGSMERDKNKAKRDWKFHENRIFTKIFFIIILVSQIFPDIFIVNDHEDPRKNKSIQSVFNRELI